MIETKKRIAKAIWERLHAFRSEAAEQLDPDQIAPLLEYPPSKEMGDLAFPCFKLSKTFRCAPVQIADAISHELDCPCVSRAENVNGYLNLYLSPEYLKNLVPDILAQGDRYGRLDEGNGKVAVLDYSSPNVAKPFHIGHLGTTVIGHSLKKIHEFAGYSCVGINYLGDWGTQFGKLILAYRMWGSREEVEKGGIDTLVALYVRMNNAISEEGKEAEKNGTVPDPKTSLAALSRAEFHKMETGDEDNLALWKWFVEISLKEYEKTYRQLGITFDSYKGESFYTDKMPAQIEIMRQKGLLKLDQGATIVDLSEYNMPPCLILKSDGSTLYPTRDIAAAVYRKNTYHFDKCIYVTSNQQCQHFAQWFKVIELMGYDWYDQLVHVPYGTVSIEGTKLATRTGNVILLRDLFGLAIEKVKGIMQEKNPDLENRDEVAEAVGVGAIVFYYLTNNRIKDINFSMEDALSFDGNTGPYVQYTYARMCSVLRRAQEERMPVKMVTLTDESELDLVKVLIRFREKVTQALHDYEPSVIARYALDVASAFNRFYHGCKIISAEKEEVRSSRLALVEASKTVLGNAFDLICLKRTERV